MPHLVILYTGNLDAPVAQGGSDIDALCRSLADAMLGVKDEAGKQVFPTGGVRVLAYPAPHFAVADGGAAGRAAGQAADYGFVYLNLRMGRGRSAAVQRTRIWASCAWCCGLAARLCCSRGSAARWKNSS